MIRGRRQQIVLVGDVPIDRPAAGRQPRRERAEGQGALALAVEDLDRGLDDPLLRERVRAPFGPPGLSCHGHHLDMYGTAFQ